MAAPKGNQYAKGCKTNGAPAKYKTVEDLQAKVDEYFEYCKKEEQVPNMLGICWFLDFDDRESFMDQGKRGKDFLRTVKRAKSRMYDLKMQAAVSGKMNPTIFIFDAVNNHDMFNTRSENKNDNKHEGELNINVNRTIITGGAK